MPAPHVTDLHDSDGPTLQTYVEWLRRRWWILVLAAFIGVGGGLLTSLIQPKTYTSTTSVLVRQPAPDGSQSAKVNLDTEAQLVRSLVVAERAKGLMRSTASGEELVRSLTVTVPPNSQIMQITYTANTPEQTQAGSHSFAQAYLDLRLATATRALENETTSLRQQISEVNKQLGVVAGRIAAAPANSVERARAEADRNVLTNQLATLNSRLSPLLSTPLDPGEIISDAPLPRKPSGPNRTLNLASGLAAGFLLGIVVAMVLDRLDTRVRRGRDITARTGLAALLDLPSQIAPLAIMPPTHRIARELGRLRNVLLSGVAEPRTPGHGRKLLLADTSAGPVAGFVAGNLGAAYARTGQQVVVLSTRTDSPLPQMLGTQPRHTLADVLRRDVGVLNALTPVPGLNQLRVLLPGDLDAEAELPIATMREILDELATRFDHVLIETAQPTITVEAQALARYVEAVILVVERGRTRSSEIVSALRQFEQVDAPVLGAVLAPPLPAPAAGGATPVPPGGAASKTAGTPAGTPTGVDGRVDGLQNGAGRPGGPIQRDRRPSPVPRQEPSGPGRTPPAADSTIILPRVSELDQAANKAVKNTSNGPSTVYRSTHGDALGNDVTTHIPKTIDAGQDRE